jgi:hypothetical protein
MVFSTFFIYLTNINKFFKEMKAAYEATGVPREIRQDENLGRLSNIDRWSIYFTWANIAINKIRTEIQPLQVI